MPGDRRFLTKPQLLQAMIERAIAAGVPFRWVTADEAYGDNGPLRSYLEKEKIPYVLAVARDHLVTTPTGPRRADVLAATPGPGSASAAATAPRERAVMMGAVRHEQAGDLAADPPIVSRPSELAFYLCHTPQPAPAQPSC